MGVLTLAQMRTEVDSAVGAGRHLPARIDTWINLAYTEVSSGIDFEDLDDEFAINTIIGTREYAGPANPLVIQLLRDETSDNLLTWVPKNEHFRLDRSATGAPVRWTRRGSDILLYPSPDAVYALLVLFKITPAPLAGDGDVTILPPYVDNALIMLGAAYGFMASNEDQRAVLWVNRAINYLSSRLTDQDLSFLLGGLAKTQPMEAQSGA